MLAFTSRLGNGTCPCIPAPRVGRRLNPVVATKMDEIVPPSFEVSTTLGIVMLAAEAGGSARGMGSHLHFCFKGPPNKTTRILFNVLLFRHGINQEIDANVGATSTETLRNRFGAGV